MVFQSDRPALNESCFPACTRALQRKYHAILFRQIKTFATHRPSTHRPPTHSHQPRGSDNWRIRYYRGFSESLLRFCKTAGLFDFETSLTSDRVSHSEVTSTDTLLPTSAIMRPATLLWLSLSISSSLLMPAVSAQTQSGDAWIQAEPNRWTLGTASVQRVIEVVQGRFREIQHVKTAASPAGLHLTSKGFFVGLADDEMIDGSSGDWELLDDRTTILEQGELQLQITLQRHSLQVTKTFVLYPSSSVIREWVTFKNVGTEKLLLTDPGFLDISIGTTQPAQTSFCWLTGGASVWGSWRLYEEPLTTEKQREFDTYDPFPIPDDIVERLAGNGTQARILHNDQQIWPPENWQVSLHSQDKSNYDLKLDVQAGDRILFVANSRDDETASASYYAPVIKDSSGHLFLSWGHYSTQQGKAGWSYYYYEGDELRELVNVPGVNICLTSNKNGCWVRDPEKPLEAPRIGWNYVQPGAQHDVVRVWTAEQDDSIHITGDFSNGWNYCGGSERGPKGGSASYAPWYAYRNHASGDGVFIGWDYFGRWNTLSEMRDQQTYHHRLKVMNYQYELPPQESIISPKAFVGQFSGDIDNAGNACLDWQYRYLWDYTRANWFPGVRMLGAWLKGCGTNPDISSAYRKVFRVVDLMRYCGGDVYHRDWGWWRKLGNWDGPDWQSANQYLGKHDMGLLLYSTTNYAERDSKIGRALTGHYVSENANHELDVSQPEVIDAVVDELSRWQREYGAFTWRNDGGFLAPQTPDDTNVLAQDQGFRKIIQRFLDKHPDCAFQSVNNGGTLAGYEYTRFSTATSFSDGDVGILRNHWAALILPPDKTSNFPEKSQADSYDKTSWRSMLAYNVDISQDTTNPEKMEGIRELIDIYHYLESQKVVGRWVKVYRPLVEGDEDQTMYFQRLSGDARRGVILPKKPVPHPVNIRPKGLIPQANYLVSFQESSRQFEQRGSQLMEAGIAMSEILPGELIYLNLPYHPGNQLDKQPPAPPRRVSIRRAKNMGYPGVEVSWKPGSDDRWLSHHLVYRDGQMIDKVAKGTFYFDHSLGADPAAEYAIAAVDGSGNVSSVATAPPSTTDRLEIRDDISQSIDLTGSWKRSSKSPWAHAKTLTSAKAAGDRLQFSFTGRRLVWFTKLGPECGICQIEVDGQQTKVDTYSADEMWGIAVWKRDFPSPGPHRLTLTVSGQHGEHPSDVNPTPTARAAASWVHIDGFLVE